MSATTCLFPVDEQTLQGAKQVHSNNRHSGKISWKRRQALQMATEVAAYVKQFDVSLPAYYKEFKTKRKEVMLYDHYEDALDKELAELVKFYYDVKTCSKAIYAVFEKDFKLRPQIAGCWYSKNRLDPVWNYRKSQLIRKVWYGYLKESEIHKTYVPVHLVLTVPHKNGTWKGKRFYARELIAAFNQLRKCPKFKKYVYGGEYGLESKQSIEGNGMHCHLHSLIFQCPKHKIKEVREYLVKKWRKITGNESGYSGIHYEQLYCYKRDASGKFITHTREFVKDTTEAMDEEGCYSYEPVTELKEVRKKFRVGPKSSLEDYLSGVMECMKYHFKADCFERPDGSVDVELLHQVLNNTKGLRMYSRFGALYKEKKLDFVRKGKDEKKAKDSDEDIMASLDGVQERLVNPFTYKPAQEGDYRLAICCPEFISHHGKKHIRPSEPIVNHPEAFYYIDKDCSLPRAMALMAKGRFNELLDFESFERYKKFVRDG